MKTFSFRWIWAAILAGAAGSSSVHAQFVLTGTQYLQDFDSLGAGLPASWGVRTGASASTLGTAVASAPAAGTWSGTGGAFKNVASANGLTSASTDAEQNVATNRALGIRQTGSFGDPGASFVFNFDSQGKTITSVSLDLMMLSVQTRSTTWTIDFGVGTAPTTFTTLGTWADTGAFGVTSLTFDSGLTAMDNQSSVFLRITALGASTGSGSRDTMAIDNFVINFVAAAASISRGSGTVFAPASFGGNAFTAVNTALFDGTAATVSLSGTVVAGGLSFTTTGYTLAGGASDSIQVNGGITVADATTATISGKIVGDKALNKAGAGTLVLTGANSFVGAVNVSAGQIDINSDGALGAVENDITLGGTLNALASLALNAGRDLFGSGSLAIGSGNTLTVNGNVAASALTLSGAGNVVFAGSTNSLTSLTLAQPSRLTVTGGTLSMTGSLTATATSGTTTLAGGINFGSGGDRAVTVSSGGNLVLTGPVSLAGTGRLNKGGLGTLDLTGADTTAVNAVRLGTQGTAPVDGGVLRIMADTALGTPTSQFQFNSGTLQVTQATTSSAGVSIGGRSNNGVSVPTFSGSAMTFNGISSLFRATGTTGEIALNVNNTTTLAAGLAATSGTGTATNVRVGGTGTLIITGNNTSNDSTYDRPWIADGATLRLQMLGNSNNIFTATGGLSAVNGGRVIGTLDAGANLAVGAGGGGVFFNELTFADASILTYRFDAGALPTTPALTVLNTLAGPAGGTVTLNINNDALAAQNGTYVIASFVGATLTNINANTFVRGTTTDDGITYAMLYDSATRALVLNVSGSAIPEPSTAALLAGAAAFGLVASRRRRVA